MKSAGPGSGTFPAEIQEVTADGFSLRLGDEVLRVSFAEFPWFRGADPADLRNLERPSPDHLYWPALDIDLAVESIRHPERFPLVSRVGAGRA
ncbi:MAG: DUF2442 domain-containing protein [Chromatiales bacterium]|nr:DUF2442 domain-containing protein [Chromatiales bacterium]